MLHDSHQLFYRDPFGAVPVGTRVRLVLSASFQLSGCWVAWYGDSTEGPRSGTVPMQVQWVDGQALYTAYLDVLTVPGVYFYHFVYEQDGCRFYYGNNAAGRGGVGTCSAENPVPYQITVYQADLTVPKWFQNTTIYQIFPDRFYRAPGSPFVPRTNAFYYGSWEDTPLYLKDTKGDILRWEFYGGNLQGVQEKLDYIRSLGAGTVYLNPIFEASSNHRYDTANYRKVDSILGGEEAFDALLAEAKEKEVHIILDGVFNHTGQDSVYFDSFGRYGGQGAYQNPDSPYRSWFRFGATDDDYECWWGIKDLPDVNELDPSFLDYILTGEDSVLRHWFRKGISGWRLDVADELPDQFLQILRQVSEESCVDPVILGEVWEDGTNKVSYGQRRMYYTAPELHTNTNYPFRNLLLDFLGKVQTPRQVEEAFLSLQENYPRHNFYALVNMTGTHDVERLMTALLRIAGEDRERAQTLLRCYAAILFTFPGVPLIYYGDETGLEGGCDPDNRRPYPWGKENREMIDWFVALGALRQNNRVLREGEWRVLSTEQSAVMGYQRSLDVPGELEEVLVLVTPEKDWSPEVCLSGLEPGRCYQTLFSGSEMSRHYTVSSDGCLRLLVDTFLILGYTQEQ